MYLCILVHPVPLCVSALDKPASASEQRVPALAGNLGKTIPGGTREAFAISFALLPRSHLGHLCLDCITSLRALCATTLSSILIMETDRRPKPHDDTPQPRSVGIVGGGAAGLYAAMLLRRLGYSVHIFEASNRIGGRIYTHHFSSEKNQYFEAGAMRLPQTGFQQIVFDLLDYLDKTPDLPDDNRPQKAPYYLNSLGNFLRVNGVWVQAAQDVGRITPESIGWPSLEENKNRQAGDLLKEALKPLVEARAKGFDELLKFDDLSFRLYLKQLKSTDTVWDDDLIDFVETVCSQTNQFALSCVELFMQNEDFGQHEWWTIDGGMDRLPRAMAHLVGLSNITFWCSGYRHRTDAGWRSETHRPRVQRRRSRDFREVILAIPPAALKMIADRPTWSPRKEMAIRSMHFESLYKMGLRFKTRFWEKEPMPLNRPKILRYWGSGPVQLMTKGGQSTTDLPIRWIVYPSNGIGDQGPGVLLLYAWMTDAQTWLPLSPYERRSLALSCLSELYGDQVNDELMETFDVCWSTRSATGDAMFLPGQFKARFDPARAPEGDVYFAGEHLSEHHTWIAGALLSAKDTVEQITKRSVSTFSAVDTSPLPVPAADVNHGFLFVPSNPLFVRHGDGHTDRSKPPVKPQTLGGQIGFHPVGPEVTYLAGPQGDFGLI
ncbi:hypothetical protein EW146_g8691 [Bondarzewia mesenterica]|uniref:Amine oxidase domain-containing protein n=1 Tax=Bondarzewia mesenterica TaxID=1095465 RepID=A0A4S4LCB7_9AGAM|nr:hypothetical protein EW146_g8691 [Bondarzewia mesenterica]